MKKTKIICTMGTNSNDRELMRKLIQNGMDIARFNFSHGGYEEQKARMDMLKELRVEEKKPIASQAPGDYRERPGRYYLWCGAGN